MLATNRFSLLTLCALALALGGCAPQTSTMSMPMPRDAQTVAQSASETERAKEKMSEEQAWARVEKMTPAACPSAQTPPAAHEAIQFTKCVTGLINRELLPFAAFPELVRDTRGEALKLAQAYANGEMNATQYRASSMARVQKYKQLWAQASHAKAIDAAASSMWSGDKKAVSVAKK